MDIGLNGSLLLGAQSLNAQQSAIATIGNNISNVNTPGYARQRANLVTNVQNGAGGEMDMGAAVSDIESLRSPLLDSLVQQSLGSQGYADNQASLTSHGADFPRRTISPRRPAPFFRQRRQPAAARSRTP